MNGPTGLIFAMRSRFTNQSGTEALFNEADSAFSGQNEGFDVTSGFTATGASNVGLGTTAQQWFKSRITFWFCCSNKCY